MVTKGLYSVDGEQRVVTNSDEFTATQVSVGTSPTLLAAANTNRKFIEIANTTAAALFVGGATVATTTGHQLAASSGRLTLSGSVSTAAIYGIVASSTNTVTVLEF